MPWPPLGRLRALILNWFVMDFICFLHTFSRLHNCIDFDLYFHAFRCHGRAKNCVFTIVLQHFLFKFRRIQKSSQESLGITRVSIDRLWSFLWHISACHSKCWFNGVGGGGGKNTISHTSTWNKINRSPHLLTGTVRTCFATWIKTIYWNMIINRYYY